MRTVSARPMMLCRVSLSNSERSTLDAGAVSATAVTAAIDAAVVVAVGAAVGAAAVDAAVVIAVGAAVGAAAVVAAIVAAVIAAGLTLDRSADSSGWAVLETDDGLEADAWP